MDVNNDTDDSWTTKSSSSGSRSSPLEAVLEGSKTALDPPAVTQTVSEDFIHGGVEPAVVGDIFSQAGDSPFMVYDNVNSKDLSKNQVDSIGQAGDAARLSDIVKSVSDGISDLTVQSEDKVNCDIVHSQTPELEVGAREQEDDIDDGIKEHGMTEQEMVDC